MIAVITGTPGTGKSTVCDALSRKMDAVCYHLDELVRKGLSIGYEPGKKSMIADLEGLKKRLREIDRGIIEGHYSHLLGLGEVVIVLRTHPRVLSRRLIDKGFSEEKIKENLECEALDLCLIESLEHSKRVYEVDTTNRELEDTVEAIMKIMGGGGDEFLPGKIDWSEEYFYGMPSGKD
jgi:adenylate kinase